MSVYSYQSDIARITREIGDCDKDASREQDKISRLISDIASLERSITSSTQASTRQSKMSQIASKNKDLASATSKLGDINKKKADKQSDLSRKQQSLKSAQDQEARSREQEDRRRHDTELRRSREMTQEMERQRQLQYEIADTTPQIIDLTRLPPKIKVLFLASSPENEAPLRLDVEVRSIQEKIRASEHRDAVDLVSRWAVRTSDLLQHLNEHTPHVVHFSGHGSSDGDILFEGPDGNSRSVSKEALVQVMNATTGNIRLVVFNSCFSRDQAEAVTQHVEAAIGMNTSIGDTAAQVFAAQFYSAIGFGKSISEAFEQARAALMLESIPEENTPELFVKVGTDAANIYLVRPEGKTSASFVRSPTALLPDLTQNDMLVLKTVCASDAKQPGCFINISDVAEALQADGLGEEDVKESVSLLSSRGYLKDAGAIRDFVFVTNHGFDRYATAFLSGYADTTRQIADAIVNHNLQTPEDIKLRLTTDTDEETIERILDIFEDRGFVKLLKALGSHNYVYRWHPLLKRWLDGHS